MMRQFISYSNWGLLYYMHFQMKMLGWLFARLFSRIEGRYAVFEKYTDHTYDFEMSIPQGQISANV